MSTKNKYCESCDMNGHVMASHNHYGRMKECIICRSKMPLSNLVDHLNDKLMLIYNLLIVQEEAFAKLKKKKEDDDK